MPRAVQASNGQTRASKDEIYWKILNAAINLDFRKGHQQWTLSELARVSGVTRSLIYYYFGKSKSDILGAAVQVLGEEFFGLTRQKLGLWETGKVAESVLSSRRAIEASPHLGAFYLVHRPRETEVGESLRKLEAQYFKKLNQFFPQRTSDELKGIFGLFFGLVFAPDLTERSVEEAIRVGLKVSRSKKTSANKNAGISAN